MASNVVKTLPSELNAESTYAVRIRSVSALGVPSDWSETLVIDTSAAGLSSARRLVVTPDGMIAYDHYGRMTFNFSSVPAIRTNLVRNPSFEINTTGWEALDGVIGSISRTTSDYFVGQPGNLASLEVAATQAATGVGFISSVARRITVTAGLPYTVTAYVKVPNGQPAASLKIGLRFYNAGGALISEKASISPSIVASGAGWIRLSNVSITAPTLSATAGVVVYSNGPMIVGQKWLADGVMVEQSVVLREYFDGSTSAGTARWLTPASPHDSTSELDQSGSYSVNGGVFTESIIQTSRTVSTSGGVKMSVAGIEVFNPSGLRTFFADAATGLVTITGSAGDYDDLTVLILQAQADADEALLDAASAQSTADSAQTYAEAVEVIANSAVNDAADAQTMAEAAYDVADTAIQAGIKRTITNKALTSNVATLTTSVAHDYSVGWNVIVSGVDATFNGVYTIASTPTSTTFTYAKTASNVGSQSATGSAIASGTIGVNILRQVTQISGGLITTGAIISNNYAYTSGNFNTAGTILDVTNGMFRTKNLLVSATGDVYISGSAVIGATSASTVVSNAATGASALQPGTAASDVNSNVTTITGGKIRTGQISSTGFSGVTDGSAFSTTGTNYNLDNGSITAKAFRIDTSGNAVFSGTITGSTITGSTITGGTVQSAASGDRIVLNGDFINIHAETGDYAAGIFFNNSSYAGTITGYNAIQILGHGGADYRVGGSASYPDFTWNHSAVDSMMQLTKQFGDTFLFLNGSMSINDGDGSTVKLFVDQGPGQTTDLMQFRDSTGTTVLSYIDKDGVFHGGIVGTYSGGTVDWVNIINEPSPTITLTGAVTGSGSLPSLLSGSIATSFDYVTLDARYINHSDSSSYVASITGTANQVIASASTGAVTLSLPQSIHTAAGVTFATVTTSGNVIVGGNLTVNGTTVTINSTTVTVDDPIFTLGGDTAPASDDDKDRGIEYRWHNGTAAKIGFFGYDDSTGKFTFIPDATNTSEVFSGTKGGIDVGTIDAAGAVILATTLNVTGVSTFDGGIRTGASAISPSGGQVRLGSTQPSIHFDRSGTNEWLIYQNAAAPLNLRDIVNSRMHVTFTSGASATAAKTEIYSLVGINMVPVRQLDVTGTFGATGASQFGSTLGVTGATTLSSTLGVTGATTLSSTLSVTGTSTLTGNVGIGTAPGTSKVTILDATDSVAGQQIRIGLDGTKYYTIGRAPSSGNLIFTGVDPTPGNIAYTFDGTIKHPSYVSQISNWGITALGAGDFRYLYADELHAKAFIADLEQALAGLQIIAKSVTMVAQNFTIPAATGTATLIVRDLPSAENMQVFDVGDWVVLRVFSRLGGGLEIADCVGTVTDYVDGPGEKEQTWTFTRGTGADAGTATAGGIIKPDSIVIDYGVPGSGYHEINAIDGQVLTRNVTFRSRNSNVATITTSIAHGFTAGQLVYVNTNNSAFNGTFTILSTPSSTTFTYANVGANTGNNASTGTTTSGGYQNAPYSQTVTWSGSPTASNRTVRTRLGRLTGITGNSTEYGLVAGPYTASPDDTSRFIRASNTAFEMHGMNFHMYSGGNRVITLDRTLPSIAVGSTVPTNYLTGTGFWTGIHSGSAKLHIGNPSGDHLRWTGSALEVYGAIKGSSTIDVGTDPTGFHVDVNGNMWLGTSVGGYASNVSFRVSNAGAIDVGGADATSWHVDATGNMWAGAAAYNQTTNPFAVSNAGAIRAVSGVIAGWTIDTGKIYMANAHLNSTGYISFGATPPTSYGNNVGVWLGYSSGAKMSLYADASNYLQWDGSKLLVKGANFTLDASGNLSATNATFVNGTFSGSITSTATITGGTVQTAASGDRIVMSGDFINIYAETGDYAAGIFFNNSSYYGTITGFHGIQILGQGGADYKIGNSASYPDFSWDHAAVDSMMQLTKAFGTTFLFLNGSLSINDGDGATVKLFVDQGPGQVADLVQFRNDTGSTVLSYIDKDGIFHGGVSGVYAGGTVDWSFIINEPTFINSITGTANQVLVNGGTSLTTGAVTLSLPQSIHTGATPTFVSLTLSQATGSAPLTVSSTTVVANLNADLLDGQHGAYYLDWTNVTNKPDPVITLGGDLSGSVTLTDLASGTLTATIVANAVALGADTTGNYTATVAGTSNQITVSGATGEGQAAVISLPSAVTMPGSLAVTTTLGVTGATTISTLSATSGTFSSTLDVTGNTIITGNLTVHGTTFTVNSTTVTIDDPIFTIGGDTAPAVDDNKDRGIEFRWHNGTTAKVGFFGYDDSTGKFTFIPDATNTSEVFSGTKGTLDASIEWADVLSKPDPVITLGGDLSGSVTLTDLTSGTLTATIVANAVALGADTTGDYLATLTGTANQITVTGSGGESATPTLSLPSTVILPGSLAVTTTLGVTGTSTLGVLGAGATTLASLGVTGAATVGTTLGVTGATTLSSTLAAGASTLASLSVTGSATIGTTLGVTGAVTMASTLAVTDTIISGGQAAFTIRDGAGATFTPGVQRVTASGVAGISAGVRDGSSNYRAGIFADHTNGVVGLSWDTGTGSIPFVIRTAGGEAIRIEMSTRNVGIGMTATRKLDVAGTFGATGNATLGGTLNVAGQTNIDSLLVVTHDNANLLTLNRPNATAASQIQIQQNGTNRIHIGYNDSTGVGGGITTNGLVNAGYVRASQGLHLAVSANGAAGITIDTGANVGIGMSNPSRKLDVTGTFGATGAATLGSTLSVAGLATLSAAATVGTTLGVTGLSTLTGGLRTGDGTASAPAMSFTGNTNSGFYNIGGSIGFASGGVEHMRLTSGGFLQSVNPAYVSQTTGGAIDWSTGSVDMRYGYFSEMHVKIFTADIEQALAGMQIIAKSVAVLAKPFTAPAAGGTTTLWVEDLPSAPNMQLFETTTSPAGGDYVAIREFSRASGSLSVTFCIGRVSAYASGSGADEGLQSYTFTRLASDSGTMTASTVIAGEAIVLDFGLPGNGWIEQNAIDGVYGINSPYTQVATWSTSPLTPTVRSRMGNLRGITSIDGEYGFIAGTYLSTNGQYIRASTQAFELHGINLLMWEGTTNVIKLDRTAPSLAIGNDPAVAGVPTGWKTGKGFWIGKSGSDYKMHLGDPANNLLDWDGATLTATGTINAKAGNFSGTVTVGTDTNKINLVATGTAATTNIGVGTGGYGTSGQKVWIAADGKFSLGTALTFDTSGNLTVTGAITGGTVDIGGADADSFHVNSTGQMWMGDAAWATAPFRVDADGSMDVGGNDTSSWHVDKTGYMWSGATIANKATAPFQVLPTGVLVAGTGANIVTLSGTDATYRLWVGHATATSAPFAVRQTGQIDVGLDDATSWHVDETGFMWSGATVANKATAPFRVTNAGSLTATLGTIATWIISTTTLASNNVTLNSAGSIVVGTGTNIATLSSTDGTYRIWAGHGTSTSAPFAVRATGQIDVGLDDATSWHVDDTGNMWSGATNANKAIAPFRVSNLGALVAESGFIGSATGGWGISQTAIKSTYGTYPAKLANVGYYTTANGSSGYVEVADSVDNSPTGDFSLAASFELTAAGTIRSLISKGSSGGTNTYRLYVDTADRLIFSYFDTGPTQRTLTLPTALTEGKYYQVLAVLDYDNGSSQSEVDFYVVQYDGVPPREWPTSWGSPTTITGAYGVQAPRDTSAPLRVGSNWGSSFTVHNIYRAALWTGDATAGGTKTTDFDFTDVAPGATSFTLPTGQTATVVTTSGGGVGNSGSAFWFGAGGYAQNNTPVYMDSTGRFSLGDKLTFDVSGNLTISGAIDIGGADTTSFHVDTTGNLWAGAAAYNITTNPFAVSAAGVLRAVSGTVGGWTLGATALTAGSGSNQIGVDAGGTNPAFYAGSSGTPGTAPFRVTNAGALTATNATITGAITATSGSFSGTITAGAGSVMGGFTLGANTFTAGAGANQIGIDTGGTNPAFYAGSSGTPGSALFRVTNAGALTATSGSIAGWLLSSNYLSTASGDLVLYSDGTGITLGGVDGILNLSVYNHPTKGVIGQISVTNYGRIVSDDIFEIEATSGLTFDAPGSSFVGDVGVTGWIESSSFITTSGNVAGATGTFGSQLNLGQWSSFGGTTTYYGLFNGAGSAGNYIIMANATNTFISTPSASGSIYLRPGLNETTYGVAINDNGGHVCLGNWDATGFTMYAAGFTVAPSTLTKKEDIVPIEPATARETILGLEPVTFKFRDRNELVDKEPIPGLIAEWTHDVLPSVVAGDINDPSTLGIDYMKIVPFLIGAIQEHDAQIVELKSRIQAQAIEMEALKSLIEQQMK